MMLLDFQLLAFGSQNSLALSSLPNAHPGTTYTSAWFPS